MEKYNTPGGGGNAFQGLMTMTTPSMNFAAQPTVPAGGQVYTYGPNGELVQKQQ